MKNVHSIGQSSPGDYIPAAAATGDSLYIVKLTA